MKHLWEIKHPYYMCEGCYFSNDCHQEFDTWASFLDEFGKAEEDYNWVIRWDWIDSNYKDNEIDKDLLKIQFFIQRKAYPISCSIEVFKHQEDEIEEYLKKQAQYMKRMWEPFL